MTPPRVLKFRDVKRIFASFGVQAVRSQTVGHKRKRHWLLLGPGAVRYPIPAHGENDDVFRTYIEAARRAFRLTPQHGVSDADFYGRR
jgi:hypothetical protein